MVNTILAFRWKGDSLELLDQRKLPHIQQFYQVHTLEQTHAAIKDMVVRGAPLIGITAIWGLCLWLDDNKTLEELFDACEYLKTARPTAVNLTYEVDEIYQQALIYREKFSSLKSFKQKIQEIAFNKINQLKLNNLKMAQLAIDELQAIYGQREKMNLLTICNTGTLACGELGTALGVIQQAYDQNLVKKVYACETRPYLQGSRLTAYELLTLGIPFDLIVEGAVSYLMRTKKIHAVLVGADRIVKNGDTANKIGTSTLSIVAKCYHVPFYVVAPASSFDNTLDVGDQINIELRDEKEILAFNSTLIAPEGAHAWNPSFDITDHEFITGIICENGIIRPEKNKN